jgi:hypothetical protein
MQQSSQICEKLLDKATRQSALEECHSTSPLGGRPGLVLDRNARPIAEGNSRFQGVFESRMLTSSSDSPAAAILMGKWNQAHRAQLTLRENPSSRVKTTKLSERGWLSSPYPEFGMSIT